MSLYPTTEGSGSNLPRRVLYSECIAPHSIPTPISLSTSHLRHIVTRPSRFLAALRRGNMHLSFVPLDFGLKRSPGPVDAGDWLHFRPPGFRSKAVGWSDPYQLLPGGRWVVSLSRKFLRCWDIHAVYENHTVYPYTVFDLSPFTEDELEEWTEGTTERKMELQLRTEDSSVTVVLHDHTEFVYLNPTSGVLLSNCSLLDAMFSL